MGDEYPTEAKAVEHARSTIVGEWRIVSYPTPLSDYVLGSAEAMRRTVN